MGGIAESPPPTSSARLCGDPRLVERNRAKNGGARDGDIQLRRRSQTTDRCKLPLPAGNSAQLRWPVAKDELFNRGDDSIDGTNLSEVTSVCFWRLGLFGLIFANTDETHSDSFCPPPDCFQRDGRFGASRYGRARERRLQETRARHGYIQPLSWQQGPSTIGLLASAFQS